MYYYETNTKHNGYIMILFAFALILSLYFFSIHPSALALNCYKCQPDTETGLCTQYTDSCGSQCSSMTTTAYAGKSNKKSITGEFHDDSPL